MEIGVSKQQAIHFIAIGGIGMSAYAEILLSKGFKVQGSDISDSANLKRLSEKGATVWVGHSAKQIDNAALVVTSTAISNDNPELLEAQKQGLEIIHRGELLARILANFENICISGTHGKTTTTALTYTALCGGEEAGIINGGVLPSIGTNAKLGKRDVVAAEADESDQSFLQLKPSLAVITNIEPEHLEHYEGDFNNQIKAFRDFALSADKCLLCVDDPVLMDMKMDLQKEGVQVITYGLTPMAEIYAQNIEQEGLKSHFDLYVRGEKQGRYTVNLPGKHYVQNAVAALEAAHIYGVPFDDAAAQLATFQGVGRRFNVLGTYKGAMVVDDYAHHPTEIRATILAAKNGIKGKLYAVIQPHRYTRLQEHMEGFATCAKEADKVFIAPVHAAGEDEIDNVDSTVLADKANAVYVANVADLEDGIANVTKDDIILIMGAGTSTQWAKELAK